MPTVAVNAAGWRIEPPVSVAVAPAQSQAATGGRAAGRAARHEVLVRALRPPGIDHRAVIAGLVGRAHGELVHVELAEHHGTIGPQICGDGRFVARLEAVENVAARLGVGALGREKVLDAERNALQRAALALRQTRVGRGRHLPCLVRRDGDIGVERAIGGLDRRQVGIGQFAGGDLLRDKLGTRFGDRQSGQFSHRLSVQAASAAVRSLR